MKSRAILAPAVALSLAVGCQRFGSSPPEQRKIVTIRETGPQKSAPHPGPPAALTPPGTGPYFWLTADGTQAYACTLADAGAAWTGPTPDAVLYYPGTDKVFGKHFAGPTWLKTDDQSTFIGSKGEGFVSIPSPDDAGFDAPWLLVPRKGGSDAGLLAPAIFIQRLDTEGGLPANQPLPCDATAARAGLTVKVPYRAKYVLLRAIPAAH